jgi:hypothetical protein
MSWKSGGSCSPLRSDEEGMMPKKATARSRFCGRRSSDNEQIETLVLIFWK